MQFATAALAFLALSILAGGAARADEAKLEPDVVKFHGLNPEDAARDMTLPPGFKATLFAGEPDIVQPIAFTIDARGRLWVVQGMTYPVRAANGKGRDSILIFEDTNGDGKFDKRIVFMEGLNLVSGIEVGFGGVWVGAAPNFMFIPADETADDPKPLGKPQILLDGWGYTDTHETLNTFTWGPDGWLYGCHGVFVQSHVGKPGTPPEQRVHINAGVWRYHPTKHIFERFAEGTSNPWGIDFDEHGQLFMEGCVIPHLWHVIQNARYQRQGGQHDEPYTFDDIKTIADHLHWLGGNGPHAANGRSDTAGGGHAHAGMMVYLGDNFPDEWRGKLFMNNIHGSRLNMDVPEVQGSGFVGHHGKDFCLFNDTWSQIVNLRYGPDGGVYLIDWYDQNQCHNSDPKVHDRSNGRIFKITYGDVKKPPTNLAKLADAELVKLQGDKNDWLSRTARRVLQERTAAGKLTPVTRTQLGDLLAKSTSPETEKLRALWCLHATGGVSQEQALAALHSPTSYVVAWAIQLLCETGDPSDAAMKEFARLAKESPSPVVRLYLASAVLRTSSPQRAEVLTGLLAHGEDAKDHNLPLMYWYGIDALSNTDPDRAIAMASQSPVPNLLGMAARRTAMAGGDAGLASVIRTLAATDDAAKQLQVLQGLNGALKGRRGATAPQGWDAVEAKLTASADASVRTEAQVLAVRFGSKTAFEQMRKTLADVAAPADARRLALDALAGAKDPGLPPVLYTLLDDAELRGPALRALAGYNDPQTPKAVLGRYTALAPAEKKDALVMLASRLPFAREMIGAVETKIVDSRDLSADIIRQLRGLNDSELDARVSKVWGTIRATPQDKLARIAQLRTLVEARYPGVDLPHGRLLFNQTCAQCHTLFDTGGHVGPDITGSDRANIAYLLENVVDPNALIPADYQASVIDTTDDRTIIGIVKKQDAQSITVVTQNETLTLPRSDIAKLKPSVLSMMPEGLLDHMADKDIRDLIAYVRYRVQVPLPEGAPTAIPAGGGAAAPAAAPVAGAKLAADEQKPVLFNGKDLTGWEGEMSLWSVENGEIVGKTKDGIKKNQFLKSKQAYGDFHLIVKVKLTPDKANSGIQFHSTPVPNSTEMLGPQADIGAGWWGKLYEESSGRKLLFPKEDQKFDGDSFVHKDDWNTYEVLAIGNKIRTAINGHVCTDLEDDKVSKTGVLGLQIHAGGPTEVHYKDFEFELNPKFEMKTVKE